MENLFSKEVRDVFTDSERECINGFIKHAETLATAIKVQTDSSTIMDIVHVTAEK